MSRFRALWAAEGWFTRAEMVLYRLIWLVTPAFVGIAVLAGLLTGEWATGFLLSSLVLWSLADAKLDLISWRRRALEAEKPLPPTMVVTEYPTEGSAAIARMVEQQRRTERQGYALRP